MSYLIISRQKKGFFTLRITSDSNTIRSNGSNRKAVLGDRLFQVKNNVGNIAYCAINLLSHATKCITINKRPGCGHHLENMIDVIRVDSFFPNEEADKCIKQDAKERLTSHLQGIQGAEYPHLYKAAMEEARKTAYIWLKEDGENCKEEWNTKRAEYVTQSIADEEAAKPQSKKRKRVKVKAADATTMEGASAVTVVMEPSAKRMAMPTYFTDVLGVRKLLPEGLYTADTSQDSQLAKFRKRRAVEAMPLTPPESDRSTAELATEEEHTTTYG